MNDSHLIASCLEFYEEWIWGRENRQCQPFSVQIGNWPKLYSGHEITYFTEITTSGQWKTTQVTNYTYSPLTISQQGSSN